MNEKMREILDVIVNAVNLHHVDKNQVTAETPLTQGGLGMDSVDILEAVVAIEHRFGVKVPNAEVGKQAFQNIGTIAQFIQQAQSTATH